MKTYKVLFAEDVPHYVIVDIKATNDQKAIALARDFDRDDLVMDPEWGNSFCHRIVEIQDGTGQTIAENIPLDGCFVRYGGEPERLLCEAAPELLRSLKTILFLMNVDDDGDFFICKEGKEEIKKAQAIIEMLA